MDATSCTEATVTVGAVVFGVVVILGIFAQVWVVCWWADR